MEDKYKVRSSTFLGQTDYGYKYEIVFNKSIEYTDRFKGIEDGLDDYVKKERIKAFKESIPNVWHQFKNLFSLFR